MVCGNMKGKVNCTYTFVAGRSTSRFYFNSSEQHKTAKAKKYKRDDISEQLSHAFWKNKVQAPFDFKVLCKAVAQPEIHNGQTRAMVL